MEGTSRSLLKQPGPILSLSPTNLGHVADPADTEYISSLWHVFSKCAENIENGRRLENMSWRLWNRELFLADDTAGSTTDLASSTSSVPSIDSAPTLSTSGESSQSSTISRKDLNTSTSRRLKTSASLDNTRVMPQNPNRQSKHLSSEQLQQLFELFKPAEKEIENWKKLRDERKNAASKKVTIAQFPGTTVQQQQKPQLSQVSQQLSPKSGTVTPAKASVAQQLPPPQKPLGLAGPAPAVPGPPALDRSRPSRAASRPSLFERSTMRRSSPPAMSRLELSDDSDDFVSTDEDEDDYDSIPAQSRELSLESNESSKSLGEPHHQKQPQPLSAKHRTNTSTSIVRGFDPNNVSVSVINRSPTNAYTKPGAESGISAIPTAPRPASSSTVGREGQYTRAKVPREKMFFIESSPSDSEDYGGDSLSTNGDKDVKPKRSSLFNSIKSSDLHNNNNKNNSYKTNSAKNSANQYEQAVVDDDDDEWGNDSDWDSVDDESDSSFDDKAAFARDDSQKKPLVRPSLLSSLFLSNPALLQEQQNQQLLKLQKQKQAPQSVGTKLHQAIKAKPVNPTENLVTITATTHAPPPTAQMMSPRTTRRNMLSSELSESLRKNLLWERQRQPGKFSSNSKAAKDRVDNNESSQNPPLRKSYTSANVPDLVSGNPSRNKSATDLLGTWREDLDETNMDFNYHARGW
ncbi:hypothetical protein TRVA0_013S02828 [Trichomonascus vanleenenianus]|uniref:uncharacterized protein n=1 Tax=Trichomonascus vanleenenianus TaxID=2268995 RepID=UPI003ECAF6AE